MSEILELQEKIKYLQAEVKHLREREDDTKNVLRTIIQKLHAAAVVVDTDLNVLYVNQDFIELLDWQSKALIASQARDANNPAVKLKDIVADSVFKIIQGTHLSGDDSDRADFHLPDGDFNISVYSIRRGDLTIAIVRNMNNPEVRTAEIVTRLQQTIDRNMSMIQNIASLLGEEVSHNASELNSIIKIIQYPDEKTEKQTNK